METALLAAVVAAGLYTLTRIRVVRDTERLAVFRGSEFVQLRGPGLVLALPMPGIRYHRIAYRAEGIIGSGDRVTVGAVELPFESLAPLSDGARVRVVGFAPFRVHVEPEPH